MDVLLCELGGGYSTRGFPSRRRFEGAGSFVLRIVLLLLPYDQILRNDRLELDFLRVPDVRVFYSRESVDCLRTSSSFSRKTTMGVHRQNGSKRRGLPHISLSSHVVLLSFASGCSSAFIPVGRHIMSPTATTGLRVRKQASSTLSFNPAPPRTVSEVHARNRSPLASLEMTTGREGEVEAGFLEKFKTGWNTVIPVGDPDELPPCPSGVSSLPKPAQVGRQGSRNALLG